MGIEPTYSAWEADVLPLNYTRGIPQRGRDFSVSRSARHCIIQRMIQVIVNGAAQRLDRPLVVAELVERLALGGKKIAVERNGEIVPKSAHGATLLADGDRLEIVVAVGGG